MKKVLIISYSFYPKGGIGTRRWSFFIKELIKNDVEVHVLTTDYLHEDKNVYLTKDFASKISIHRVKSNVPHLILREKLSFFGRLVRKLVSIKNTRLGMIDYADSWEQFWIPKAYDLIEKYSINNVLVTGPPSSLHAHSVRIKARFPEINLIQDYRDLWNIDREYYNHKNHRNFIEQEQLMVHMSDHIFTVNRQSKTLLESAFGIAEDKVKVLYNGFEESCKKLPERDNLGPLRMVYSGRLPRGRQKGLQYLIRNLETKSIDKGSFQLHLYTDSILDESLQNSPYIVIHSFVSPSEVLEIVNKYDIGLTINDYNDHMAFGSKIYDYIACRLPIFCISERGELTELLKSQGLPVSHYSDSSMCDALESILSRNFPRYLDKKIVEKFDVSKSVLKIVNILC